MKILVTGSSGLIGKQVCRDLIALDHNPIGFDIENGLDILSTNDLNSWTKDCGAIVHCAALLGRQDETPEDIERVNVEGTINVLNAAEEANVTKFVFLSSVDVLGVFKGERLPDYLPLDDQHPSYPSSPYALSKHIGELACKTFQKRTGIATICLRPPGVWNNPIYDWITEQRVLRASFEWDPYWEYGAFIDVRDLSLAITNALAVDFLGFRCGLVSAPDVTTSGRTAIELSKFVHPNVPWVGDGRWEDQPFHSLVDAQKMEQLLNWVPKHTWQDYCSK